MQYYCAWFLFFAFLFVTELFVKLCFVVSNDFFVNYYKIKKQVVIDYYICIIER